MRPYALVAVFGLFVAMFTGRAQAQSAPYDKVQHVVVLMNENRSTDEYLGHLHQIDPAFEAEPANATNPDPLHPGKAIGTFHQTAYCESADLNHGWSGAHHEFDNGKMDGFTAANVDPSDPSGSRTMGYYTKDDLPYYYGLYSTFATNDRYFSSVMGPTYPNRFFSYAATSWGMTKNDTAGPTDFPGKSILNLLDAKSISWKVYFTEIPFVLELKYARDNAAGHLFPISQYYADAAAGNLPQVAFLDPGYFGSRNTESDEHPSANIQTGQMMTSKLVGALLGSPEWSSSAMFVTYDEDGGFYDHVSPPAAVIPDDSKIEGGGPYRFDHYGYRVPMVAISPFAKKHYVSHVVQDHTSILKFIETRYKLPSLTKRDAHADAMLGLFDFAHPAFTTPPTLPDASIDPAHAAQCQEGEIAGGSAPTLEP